MSIKSVRKKIGPVRSILHSKKGVVATGIGYKTIDGRTTQIPCIVVSVDQKKKKSSVSASDFIPREIDGVLTDVIPVGVITAQGEPTDKFRPAPGGVSIGHPQITAGTLGCLVQKDGVQYILSNNHVLANSNDARIGDPIYQPGVYDGGNNQDAIARLKAYVLIDFDGFAHHSRPINQVNAKSQVFLRPH